MSTKIYNAYRYRGTLFELMAWLRAFREAQMGAFVDSCAGLWEPKRFDFSTFRRDLEKVLRSGLRFSEVDGSPIENPVASVAIYAANRFDPPRPGDDILLVQFLGVSERQLARNLSKELFLDYHFQNQTGRPANIPESWWRQRERVWNRVFDDQHCTPAEAGLIYNLIGEDDHYRIAFRLFRKYHGHDTMSDASQTCELCAYNRERAAAADAEFEKLHGHGRYEMPKTGCELCAKLATDVAKEI